MGTWLLEVRRTRAVEGIGAQLGREYDLLEPP